MTVLPCANCRVILRNKYEQFRERIVYDRIDGKNIEASFVLNVLCRSCRDRAIEKRQPQTSYADQPGML